MARLSTDRRDALAARVRALLRGQNVREVTMFGGRAFLIDERMVVSAGRKGELLVRIDPARHEEMLDRGAQSATMGEDRPMGAGWITVAAELFDDDTDLAEWLEVALDHHRNA